MFDVVIRGRCLTVVHDAAFDGCHAIIVEGPSVAIIHLDGSRQEVGVLTSAMADAAVTCEIAVVARMQGPLVAFSAQVGFVVR